MIRSSTLLGYALLMASGLHAQSAEIRATLRSVDDRDAVALVSPRDDAARLRNAFVLLGKARQIRSTDGLLQSMTEFYEVAVHKPKWPYAWYGLGRAKFSLEEVGALEIRSAHQPAGAGWLNGAVTAYIRALKEDPTFPPAVVGLTDVIMEDPDAPRAALAASRIRTYLRSHDPEMTTALAIARLDIERDSLATAEALLRAYVAKGGDTGVAAWEQARIAFARDSKAEGSTLYYLAASHAASAAVRTLIARDLVLVGDSAEVAAFERMPADSVEGWLRDFWRVREIEAARPEGTRLPEHFRRVRYARHELRAQGTIQQYDFAQIFRAAPRGLDDRAVIYVRHGEPDERATFVGDESTPPNESWSYFRADGNPIFHFAKLPPSPAYRLIEELGAVGGDPELLYETRANMDPIYMQLSMQWALSKARGRAGVADPSIVSPELTRRERDRTRAMIALGTTTDSDPLDLERSWTPTTQVFGTTSGLLIAIALPAPEDLHPVPLPDGGVGYTLRLRTTAANDRGKTALDVDSIVRLRTPRPLRPGEYLNIVRAYDLPAGMQRVRVVIADSTGTRGAVRVLSGVPVVGRQADSLVLSDLIVGREGSPLVWRRPDGEIIPLHPLNAWTAAQPLTLAFDVEGTTPGTPFTVRIAISELGADSTKPPRAAVQFERQAAATREFVAQSIALNALRPGRYLLTVTVTTGDRTVKRERRITVVR